MRCEILYQCLSAPPQKGGVFSTLPFSRSFSQKLLQISKLSLLILVITFLQANASVYLNTVKLKERNSDLEKVFGEIRRQTDYDFLYSDRVLKKTVPVSMKTDGNVPINSVLGEFFNNQSLTYSIIDETIIVKRKKESAASALTLLQLKHPLEARLNVESLPIRSLTAPIIERKPVQSILKGNVTDEKGEVLPGVSIVIKGTQRGTTTDPNGNFELELPANPDGNITVVFSYVGFETSEVVIGNKTRLDIRLKVNEKALNEVVVVGYGTQKRTDVTGSVATVSADVLTSRPAPNVSNLLQGRVTGLRVTQPSGQPGRDNASLEIRGLGSFGASSAPLVLVDGVIGSLSNLSPDDIENVTVLKDASSTAIYGARAANGVVLVTTKRGKKGQTSISYKIDVGTQAATRLPDFIYNSAEYMEMYNQARARSGGAAVYTQSQIDAYRNATDRDQYPNFNQLDYYFKNATSINHHLGLSGGSDKTSYNLSLSALDQDGILPSHKLKRYNMLLNLNTQVNSFINIGANVNASHRNISEPWLTNDNIVLIVYQAGPTYKPFLPDGSGRVASRAFGTENHNRSPSAVFGNGGQSTKEYNLNTQVFADVNLAKGLVWQIKGAVNYADIAYKSHQYRVPSYLYQKIPGEADYRYSDDGAPTQLGVADRYDKSILTTFYSTLNYDKQFGQAHFLKVLAGYEQQESRAQFLSGGRLQFPVNDLREINAGATNGQYVNGSANEYALRSVFGRLNYDYKGKYLLEGNLRYDGTSRVASANRWGIFPSVSAGWRISEESFIKENANWIDNLKFRASLGTLGNQEIGLYPYQDILNLNSYAFGNTLEQGVRLTRLTDKNLKWESTRIFDLGFDLDAYKGVLGITFDWYRKTAFDILTQQPVPRSLGLSGPLTNDGKLQNTGFELELRHNKRIGDFSYGVNVLGSAFKNELLKIRTPTKGVNEVGLPYNSFFMYEWIGIFNSQEEIDNSPKQVYFTPKPGDLKIKDQNGDNVVDDKDRVTVKGRYPTLTYSFGLNASWKGFSFSAFFQGSEGNKQSVNGWGIDPFIQGTPPTAKFRDAWTPENKSQTVPAVYESGYGGISAYGSTYYLQNASYLRLKNLYLSYAIPQSVYSKIKLKGATVYISADNLITWTKYEGADPERSGDGRYAQYPQLRVLNAGLSFKF